MYHKNDPRRNAKTVSLRSISYGIVLSVVLVYAYVYYYILPVISHHDNEGDKNLNTVGTNGANVGDLKLRVETVGDSGVRELGASDGYPASLSESQVGQSSKSKGSVLSDPSQFQTIEAVNAYYDRVLSPLNTVVTNWPPENPDGRPNDWVDVVPTFDWTDAASRKAAQTVREAEKPFKIINVGALADAKKKWTYEYLKRKMGKKKGNVEVSESKSFMYWKRQGRVRTGPTTYERMNWVDFLDEAKKLDESSTPDKRHYYWHTSARSDPWIEEDLKMFDKSNDFFIVDKSEYNVPIACRVGTKGLCNENHYDTHRTFASQIFGSKRWVYQPPSECGKMYLFPDRHISARHSPIDINSGNINFTKWPLARTALAVDTVVHAGEMAYLPSNWFHHIISLEFNMQCVARSGHSLVGDDYIEECGFAGGQRAMGGKRAKKKL